MSAIFLGSTPIPLKLRKARIMPKSHSLSIARRRVIAAALLMAAAVPANAQVGNYGYGSSTAAGSGGLPTGPSSLGGIYGVSSSAGSAGAPTGLTNPGTFGYGLSTSGGPAATPTGPTNPTLPQFPATVGVAAPVPVALSPPAIGLPSATATPGVVGSLTGIPAIGSSTLGIAPAAPAAVAPSTGTGASIGVAPAAGMAAPAGVAPAAGMAAPVGMAPSAGIGATAP
jgi:hypothetical protein